MGRAKPLCTGIWRAYWLRRAGLRSWRTGARVSELDACEPGAARDSRPVRPDRCPGYLDSSQHQLPQCAHFCWADLKGNRYSGVHDPGWSSIHRDPRPAMTVVADRETTRGSECHWPEHIL